MNDKCKSCSNSYAIQSYCAECHDYLVDTNEKKQQNNTKLKRLLEKLIKSWENNVFISKQEINNYKNKIKEL